MKAIAIKIKIEDFMSYHSEEYFEDIFKSYEHFKITELSEVRESAKKANKVSKRLLNLESFIVESLGNELASFYNNHKEYYSSD